MTSVNCIVRSICRIYYEAVAVIGSLQEEPFLSILISCSLEIAPCCLKPVSTCLQALFYFRIKRVIDEYTGRAMCCCCGYKCIFAAYDVLRESTCHLLGDSGFLFPVFVGQLGNGALLHLHVQTACEAGWHRRARRGGGVRVSAREQQKLHVLRAAVAEGGTTQGENLVFMNLYRIPMPISHNPSLFL